MRGACAQTRTSTSSRRSRRTGIRRRCSRSSPESSRRIPTSRAGATSTGSAWPRAAYAAYKAAGKPFNTVLTLRTDDVGMGCLFNQLKNPNLQMYYYTSGNTQIRVAFTAAMMKLKGAKIPPTDRVPDRAAEPAGARLLRQGLSAGGLGDVADPAEPAQEDVSRRRNRTPEPEPEQSMSIPGPASPLVLSLRGVSKAFGAVQALREVSVDCRAGEIHALVGENGSGKSTLLGIASGFLAPDEGTVVIGETERRRVSPAESRRLGLGIAYQTYSHVLHLSVAENLYLAAPSDLRPTYGRMDGWAARPAGRVRPRHLADRARGDALARGETAPRGRQGAARPAEGAAPRRADDGPRAGGRRPAPRAGSRAEPRRRRDRLRQPPAAGGPRHRRPDHAFSATACARGRSRPPRCRRRASSRS